MPCPRGQIGAMLDMGTPATLPPAAAADTALPASFVGFTASIATEGGIYCHCATVLTVHTGSSSAAAGSGGACGNPGAWWGRTACAVSAAGAVPAESSRAQGPLQFTVGLRAAAPPCAQPPMFEAISNHDLVHGRTVDGMVTDRFYGRSDGTSLRTFFDCSRILPVLL